MSENNNLGKHLVAKAKVGLSRADKQKMKEEVIASVIDITPKGVSSSAHILAFTEDLGVWIATDTGGWYYWKSDVSKYVYGGMFVENPRLIDLGDDFKSMSTTEKNLAKVCEVIASRDNGELIGQGLYNYIYHAVVNGGDKVIATYSFVGNVVTFYLPFDSNDSTKYCFFKHYYGFYSNGIWNVQRYAGVEGGSGTIDYEALFNKPRINGHELVGDISTDDLGIKIENVITYKGSVEDKNALEAITEKVVGDMYNVNDTGRNYVWNGTTWDDMGEIFDINKLVTKVKIVIHENSSFDPIKETIFIILKNKFVGSYMVNEDYIAKCKNVSGNIYSLTLHTLENTTSMSIYYSSVDITTLSTPNDVAFTTTILKEVDPEKVMEKIKIELVAESGTNEQQIIYHFIENKLVGTYLVNDFYLVNCKEAYANHFYVQAGNILGSAYYTYSTPTAPEDLPENPSSLEIYRYAIQEYVDESIKGTLQKVEVEHVIENGDIEQQIIYHFIKNKKVGTYLVNDFYLVNCQEAYTNHFFIQAGNILGSAYFTYSTPTAPEDLPENPSGLEIYDFSNKEYVDEAIANAITTTLNADY